jgi:hypothetical protein
MSPRPARQRPGPESSLVRKPEPIATGGPPGRGDQDDGAAGAGTQAAPRPRRAAQTAKPDAASGATAAAAARTRAGRRSARPAARDLVGPVRRAIARQALKADVPAELALVERLHRFRLDHGMDIRDQVAIAVDEWLTGQGY